MNIVLQKMTFFALLGTSAGVHGKKLRGAAMVANAPSATLAQRSCIDGCRGGRFTKHHNIISCKNKCLKLDDEDAEYVADFLKYEDVEIIADFLSEEGGAFEAKKGNYDNGFNDSDNDEGFSSNDDRRRGGGNNDDNGFNDSNNDEGFSGNDDRRSGGGGGKKNKCKGKNKKKCKVNNNFDNDGGNDDRPRDISGPCSADAIFGGESINERGTLERAARDGTLKREYKDVWKSTKQARKRCKRSDKQTCKRKGYCMEGEEDDFGEAEY